MAANLLTTQWLQQLFALETLDFHGSQELSIIAQQPWLLSFSASPAAYHIKEHL